MGFHLGHMWPQEVAFEARSSSDKNEVSISFVQMNFCWERKRFQFDKKFFDCIYVCEKTSIKSLQMFLEGLETLALKESFFKSQTLFSDVNHIIIFLRKSRHQITWKQHIVMYLKSIMMDLRQFQMAKTSVSSKFDSP